MKTISTFYKVILTSSDLDLQTTINQADTLYPEPTTDLELVNFIRDIWRQRTITNLDDLHIHPILKFQIFDEDSTVDYYLNYNQRSIRSKTREVVLRQGTKITRWEEASA